MVVVPYAIIVCTRCRHPRTGARVAESRLADLAATGRSAGFAVELVACMAGCDQPVAVGVRAPKRATYLFGDVDLEADQGALIEFVELYRSRADGWTSEGERPEGLKGKIIARIPTVAEALP